MHGSELHEHLGLQASLRQARTGRAEDGLPQGRFVGCDGRMDHQRVLVVRLAHGCAGQPVRDCPIAGMSPGINEQSVLAAVQHVQPGVP